MDQSIDVSHIFMIKAFKDDQVQDNNNSRKSPSKKKEDQMTLFCVFIVHHQNIPEVYCLKYNVDITFIF